MRRTGHAACAPSRAGAGAHVLGPLAQRVQEERDRQQRQETKQHHERAGRTLAAVRCLKDGASASGGDLLCPFLPGPEASRPAARTRKSAFASPGCRPIGSPKVTVHRMGTGTTPALGHHALDVVDPGGHQGHVREPLGQVEEASSGRPAACPCVRARAPREDVTRESPWPSMPDQAAPVGLLGLARVRLT